MTRQRVGAVVLGALGFMALLLTVLGSYVAAESIRAFLFRVAPLDPIALGGAVLKD